MSKASLIQAINQLAEQLYGPSATNIIRRMAMQVSDEQSMALDGLGENQLENIRNRLFNLRNKIR